MSATNDFTTELEDVNFSPAYVAEIEKKIKSLEGKNEELLQVKLECEKLSLELIYMTRLKEEYEEKYNEASIKLLYLDDDESFMFREDERINSLNQKLSILVHANQDLRDEIQELKKWNQRIIDENLELKEKALPKERKHKETNTDGIVCGNIENIQIFNVRKTDSVYRQIVSERPSKPEPSEKIQKLEVIDKPDPTHKLDKRDKIETSLKSKHPSCMPLKLARPESSQMLFTKSSVSPFSRQATPYMDHTLKQSNFQSSPKTSIRKSRSVYKPSFLRKSMKSPQV